MTSATEVLRRLLDERGVEWTAPNSILRDTMTCWTAGGFYYEAFEVPEPDGTFLLTAAHQDDLTPEQAIAATLGATDAKPTQVESSGTCHMRLVYEEEDADGFIWPDHYECDACGANVNGIMPSYDTEIHPRFCPNCGAKVIEPTTNDVDAEVDA